MHHLAAFRLSQTNNTTAEIPAISDPAWPLNGNRVRITEPRQVLYAYAGVADGTRVILDIPTLNRINPFTLSPIDGDGVGGNLPAIVDLRATSPLLPINEDISVVSTRAGAAAADSFVALWHARTFTPATQGQTWTVQMSAAFTGSAWAWLTQDLAIGQGLPQGQYEVTGLRAFGTGLVCARLNFVNQVERPGCLANVSTAAYTDPFFRRGRAGRFGVFQNQVLPKLDALFSAAPGPVTVTAELDIVKVS